MKLLSWLVATQGFLKQLGLGVAAWEVDEHPADGVDGEKLLKLLRQVHLLGLQLLHLLLLEVLLL